MKEKINNLDISSILFLQLFSCSLGIAPYITIKITGIDAYISIIIGTIIGIIPILILIYIFNYEIDKPIHIKTKIILTFGKTEYNKKGISVGYLDNNDYYQYQVL